MYSVMIIDDEPVVRAGLKRIVKWEDYGFQLCEEGIDGEDGYKKIMKLMPELVLVDVKMPGINGIEMIKRARNNGYKGRFIILTGYSDFQYAKSAVALGVSAYLLKPIDEDELTDFLTELKVEIDRENIEIENNSLNIKKIRKDLLRRMLFFIEDKKKMAEEIKLYDMDFDYDVFNIVIIKHMPSSIDRCISEEEKKKVDLLLSGKIRKEKIYLDEKIAVIVKGMSFLELTEELKYNNEKVKSVYGESFFVTVGHDVVRWEDICFSFECANMLLGYEFLFNREGVINIRDIELGNAKVKTGTSEELCSLIEIGEIDKLDECIKVIEEHCRANLLQESEIKVMCTNMLIKIHAMLTEKYIKQNNRFEDVNAALSKVQRAKDIHEITDVLAEYVRNMNTIIGISNSDNVVKRMYAYMQNNYYKDLKLEGLAKLFNYNAAYLGKVFKKETGESFNNVLDNIRIENAKEMLMDTNMKVYQVSEKVGYSNIDYFYSKFKKYVGVSPKEFQKNKLLVDKQIITV